MDLVTNADTAFRRLGPEHFDEAHHLVVEATGWLNAKGICQWPRPVPAETYRERHERGENHGYFVKGQLAVVMSLGTSFPDRWQDHDPGGEYRWLATMASSRQVSRRGLGRAALEAAEDHLCQRGVAYIYLDCVEGNGFLPRFYTEAGYTRLESCEVRPALVMHLFRKHL